MINRYTFPVVVLLCSEVLAAENAVGISEDPVIEMTVESVAENDTVTTDTLTAPETLPVLKTFVKADYPADLIKK